MNKSRTSIHGNFESTLISYGALRWRAAPRSENVQGSSLKANWGFEGSKWGGGDGFMGQFAFTRAQAQITQALIRLPKWGSPPASTKQAFVYILLIFSSTIHFDGLFVKCCTGDVYSFFSLSRSHFLM